MSLRGTQIMTEEVKVVRGTRFGKLVAVYRFRESGAAWWFCLCDCGLEKAIREYSLRTGGTKSCGCKLSDRDHVDRVNQKAIATRFRNREPILGRKFGRLTVIEEEVKAFIACKCDCGEIVRTRRCRVMSGNLLRSCGCLGREISSNRMLESAKARRRGAGVSEDVPMRARSPLSYYGVLRSIKKRDGGKCVLCMASGVKLHVHHILSWQAYPEYRVNHANLVSLCITCHLGKAHGGNYCLPPDEDVAKVLLTYIDSLGLGGGVEKNGSVYFTDSEVEDILNGLVPDRIARDWGDLTLPDLVTILNRQRKLEKADKE